MKSPALLFVLLMLCCVAGCQQRMSSKLLGRWEGRPDSAAKRAERDAEKYGDEPDQLASQVDDDVQVTDWEDYDVTIVMDFVSANRVEMALDGGQPESGSWQIVAQSPAGCTIEVQTEQEDDSVVRRRFDLLLDERNGVCVGYQLTESGADAQVGALYFRRPEG